MYGNMLYLILEIRIHEMLIVNNISLKNLP